MTEERVCIRPHCGNMRPVLDLAGTLQRSVHLLTHKKQSSWVTGLKMINFKKVFVVSQAQEVPTFCLKSTASNFSDALLFQSAIKYTVVLGNACLLPPQQPLQQPWYITANGSCCTVILLETDRSLCNKPHSDETMIIRNRLNKPKTQYRKILQEWVEMFLQMKGTTNTLQQPCKPAGS